MKYFIQYPIYLLCNLKCSYCFHISEFSSGLTVGKDFVGIGGPNFSIEEYITWKNSHLRDREEIIIHFHGGEPTIEKNMDLIEEFYSKTTEERLDFLTNGLGPIQSYDRLIKLKSYIVRIGLTYHRKMIGSKPDLGKIFIDRVFKLHKEGIPIYIKELLFPEFKQEIIAHKKFWESFGIPFKIQDFKGYYDKLEVSNTPQYTVADLELLDPEYIKSGSICSCLSGYKQLMIRSGWHAGDILGCWQDPVVVGNIKENTYNPNYKAELNPYDSKIHIIGVPQVYSETRVLKNN